MLPKPQSGVQETSMCVWGVGWGGWVRELFKLGWPCDFKRASAGRNRLIVFERIDSGQKLGLFALFDSP